MRDRVAELIDSLIEDVSGSANRPSAEEIVARLQAIKAAREEIIIGVPEAPTGFVPAFALNQPITATHPRAVQPPHMTTVPDEDDREAESGEPPSETLGEA